MRFRLMAHSMGVASLLGVLAVAGGCQAEGEPLVPVAGRVTLAGQPPGEGAISFRPDVRQGNASLHHPTGHIAADGTYRAYIREREGAPPGWYKVLVFVNEPIADKPGRSHPGMPKSLIHRKYHQPETTPLVVHVQPDAPAGSYDFEVER